MTSYVLIQVGRSDQIVRSITITGGNIRYLEST